MQWIKHNKIMFFGIIAVLIVGVWYGLSSSGEAPPLLTTDGVSSASQGSPTAESQDRELVASLLALRSVTLSGNIFNDPAFISLKDFGTTIVAEPIGRPNPFAPLGRSAPAPTTPTQPAGTTGR